MAQPLKSTKSNNSWISLFLRTRIIKMLITSIKSLLTGAQPKLYAKKLIYRENKTKGCWRSLTNRFQTSSFSKKKISYQVFSSRQVTLYSLLQLNKFSHNSKFLLKPLRIRSTVVIHMNLQLKHFSNKIQKPNNNFAKNSNK